MDAPAAAGRGTGRRPLALASAIAAARASLARLTLSSAFLSGTGYHPARYLESGTGQAVRHILRHGRGDQYLLSVAYQLSEAAPALGIEFGEHVVEHEYRIITARPE